MIENSGRAMPLATSTLQVEFIAKELAEKLDAAREMLGQMRSELAADASKMAESYEWETEVAGIYPSYGEEIKSSDTEEEAELKSSELGYELAIEPGMTLTEAQSQLLSLLN